MKPRRTERSNVCFQLAGGNEDNYLVDRGHDDRDVVLSIWELTDAERRAVAAGSRIELCVWGSGHPPVSLLVEDALEDAEEAVT